MSSERYSRDELSRDLFLMVKAGLLDMFMREDGEWVFSVSEKSKELSQEELSSVLDRLEDFAEDE
jgi:hypothetical protein